MEEIKQFLESSDKNLNLEFKPLDQYAKILSELEKRNKINSNNILNLINSKKLKIIVK